MPRATPARAAADVFGVAQPAKSAAGAASKARYGASVLVALSASSGFGFSSGGGGTVTRSADDRPQCGQTVGRGSAGNNGFRCRRMLG